MPFPTAPDVLLSSLASSFRGVGPPETTETVRDESPFFAVDCALGEDCYVDRKLQIGTADGEPPMTEADLSRFIDAQAPVYHHVVAELSDGHKRTHWMWFIFPQLSGLGHSAMTQRYAIRNVDEARRYLADSILGNRLRHNVRLMLDHKGKSALEILGSPDDRKFRSCLTLFREVASNNSDRSLFTEALDQFYGGNPDPRTLELLGSG